MRKVCSLDDGLGNKLRYLLVSGKVSCFPLVTPKIVNLGLENERALSLEAMIPAQPGDEIAAAVPLFESNIREDGSIAITYKKIGKFDVLPVEVMRHYRGNEVISRYRNLHALKKHEQILLDGDSSAAGAIVYQLENMLDKMLGKEVNDWIPA